MNKKILLVEDQAVLAMSEAQMLRKHDFEVVVAYKGEKAVEIVDTDPDISLILMDIDLGRGIDGTEAAGEVLKKHDLPIVFLTSHSEQEYVKKVKEISNYGYVLKTSGEFVILESIHMAYELFYSKKQAKEKEKHYKALFYETPLGAIEYNKRGVITDCNNKFVEIIGSSRERLIGLNMIKDLQDTGLIEEIKSSVEKGEGFYDGYYTSITAVKRTPVRVFFKGLRNDEGEIYSGLGLIEDITEREVVEKALKESETRYRRIFNRSAVSLWEEDISLVRKDIEQLKQRGIHDFNIYFTEHPEMMEGIVEKIEVLDVNDTTLELYGAESKEELIGSLDKTLYLTEMTLKFIKSELVAIAEDRDFVEGEMKTKRLDGTVLDIMMRINIFYEPEQKDTILVAISDITLLKNAIKEKDELMKELNHRVKNNLAMVSSLINLKDSELGDEVDLSDLNLQIDAIRLIHDRLYRKEEITEISARDYIYDLISTVFTTFTAYSVTTECHIADISLKSKQAVSMGLILNELATNAIKHGFTSEEKAVFSVEMKKEAADSRYRLTVSNTGKPFPEDIDLDNPETLGLQIITTLVKQIEGTIELQKNPHTVFTISFPMGE